MNCMHSAALQRDHTVGHGSPRERRRPVADRVRREAVSCSCSAPESWQREFRAAKGGPPGRASLGALPSCRRGLLAVRGRVLPAGGKERDAVTLVLEDTKALPTAVLALILGVRDRG